MLITFGGSDDGMLGSSVARRLLARSDAHADIVISPWTEPAAAIADLRNKGDSRITIHHGANMVELMAGARLLIGSASTVTLEALAAGLEAVVGASDRG